MRPPKRILLIAPIADKLRYRFLLTTWGYALTDPWAKQLDCVVVIAPGVKKLRSLVKLHAPIPVVALVAPESVTAAYLAGALHAAVDHFMLRTLLKLAVARKRGPNRKPAVELAVAA